MYHVTTKAADSTTKAKSRMTGMGGHDCNICASNGKTTSFHSAKALWAHHRSAHGIRNPLRQYLDATGICPVCYVQFPPRTRALAHLTERRCRGQCKTSCRSVLEAGLYEPLPAEEVNKHDASDRIKRGLARKAGHTQPISRIPAKRAKVPACPAHADINVLPKVAYMPRKRVREKNDCKVLEYRVKQHRMM